MRGRAALVGGVLVLAALVLAVFGAAERAERSGRATAAGSSFRADETGHRAARLLLESLGFRVHSRRGARLPRGTGHVLVRVEGLPGAASTVTPERERFAEGAALAAWVEAGNGVLLLASESPVGSGFPPVRERFEVPHDELVMGPAAPVATPEALDLIYGSRPDVPQGGADELERHDIADLRDPWIAPYHVVHAGPTDTVLAVRDDDGVERAVIVESTRGRGRVIVVADPWFATNVRVAQADNAAWLAALVERLAAGGDVWIDDRALGQSATRGVLSLFHEAGFGPALVAGFVLLLLVWWRSGPSDAPDRLVRPRRAYRPEAYAELRAGLYAECLTPSDVRRMVRNEVARRLGRGDATSFERAMSLLHTRDPERAVRLQAALDGLPQHGGVSVTRHARTWGAAVGRVWNVLGEGAETTATAPSKEN